MNGDGNSNRPRASDHLKLKCVIITALIFLATGNIFTPLLGVHDDCTSKVEYTTQVKVATNILENHDNGVIQKVFTWPKDFLFGEAEHSIILSAMESIALPSSSRRSILMRTM